MTLITLDDGSIQELPPAGALAGSNCGTAGIWRFEGASPGPHVVISALIHGNEVCGAAALWPLLEQARRPRTGCLTLAFCNLAAFAKLDDANKDERRMVDEDLNRVRGRLGPSRAGETYEMRRAREILPFVGEADVLVDLHSMSSPAPALGLVGRRRHVPGHARVGPPSPTGAHGRAVRASGRLSAAGQRGSRACMSPAPAAFDSMVSQVK